MSDFDFVRTRLQAGVWEGEFILPEAIETPPALAVNHQGQVIEGHTVEVHTSGECGWIFRFPVPIELLSDGVQTFVVTHLKTGNVLTSFSIISGEVLDHDLRIELDLLRAELDILKRSFRREFSKADG